MPEFNPKDHLIKLKGKDYLPVAARLAWLREQHPDTAITTDLRQHDENVGYALFLATAKIPLGGSATGWGSETRSDFGDYLEKAETKAIGRALAALGFGTLWALELDEGGSIADSPVEARRSSAAANAPIPPLPAANLATHGVQYEQAKGREQPPAPAATPKPTEPDHERDAAKARLQAAVKAHGMSWPDVVAIAASVWPHIKTTTDLGLLTAMQLDRLADVVTGESVIGPDDRGHMRILPAPVTKAEPLVAQLAEAMR